MQYKLSELIDVEEVKELTERLYEVTGMPNAVIDIEGKILTGSGWQSVCTDFHRKNHETEKMCLKSDITVTNKIKKGEKYAICTCPLGLVDAAVKIIIEDVHVGNVFTGQFFFKPPDMSFFAAQAKKFGFDEKEYLKAVSNTPIFSEEKVKKNLDFLSHLAIMIGQQGYNKINLLESAKIAQENEYNLRKSEEKYRNIVEINPYVIFQLDKNGIITFISNRISLIMGYEPEELIGKDMSELVYKDDFDKFNKIFERRTGKRSTRRIELRVKGKNGTDNEDLIWIGINATGVYGDGYIGSGEKKSRGESKGEIIGIHGTISDLTSMKKAEKAVRTLFNSTVGFVGMDFFDNAVTNLNEWLETDFAIIGQIIDSKTINVLSMEIDGKHIHNHSYSLDGAPCAEAIKSGFISYTENICTIFPNDTDIVDLKAQGYIGTPILNKNNEPIGIICALSRKPLKKIYRAKEVMEIIAAKASAEIERIIAEDILLEKQHLNDLLLNSFPHPAMLINKKKVVIAANKIALDRGAKIGGFCWNEFFNCEYLSDENKAIAEINPHDERIKCKFCLADEVMDGSIGITNHVTVNVSDRIMDTYWVPVNEEVFLRYAVDVTNRNELEKERLKASKLESVGILAGGIAHDFNNILAAILGNISLTKINLDDKNEIIELLGEAENAGMRAKELTQQLLSFSKGGTPVKTINNISDIISDTVKFTLRGSNVRCSLLMDPDLNPAEVDEGQISQAINNLVINAKQAMSAGGALNIRAENVNVKGEGIINLPKGKYIKISVTDNGCGIPEDHLQKIFDPYFTTKQKGSGLGLATTYSIIHRHGGIILTESEIGIGTTFKIYLPASPINIKKDAKLKNNTEEISGKILVMDDEVLMRNLVARMLESFGVQVEVAGNGVETINKYINAMNSDNPFDALILDLTIPGGMGGEQTIKKLLEIDPDVKAIVSSGYSNDPVLSNYKKYGFKGFISKPFLLEDLNEKLNEVMKYKNSKSFKKNLTIEL